MAIFCLSKECSDFFLHRLVDLLKSNVRILINQNVFIYLFGQKVGNTGDWILDERKIQLSLTITSFKGGVTHSKNVKITFVCESVCS